MMPGMGVETTLLFLIFLSSLVLNVFLYFEMMVWGKASESRDALKGARNSEFSCYYQNVLQNSSRIKIMGSEQLPKLNTARCVCVYVWLLEQAPGSLQPGYPFLSNSP